MVDFNGEWWFKIVNGDIFSEAIMFVCLHAHVQMDGRIQLTMITHVQVMEWAVDDVFHVPTKHKRCPTRCV